MARSLLQAEPLEPEAQAELQALLARLLVQAAKSGQWARAADLLAW